MNADFKQYLEKGRYGEEIVCEYLSSRGWICYQSRELDKGHAFDLLVMKGEKCIALDVKTKSRRTNFMDTGIDERSYNIYCCFSQKHNLDFWILFVDEYEGCVYGNTIKALDKPVTIGSIVYPLIQTDRFNKTIRYWPLIHMAKIVNITEFQSLKLKQLSNRSYNYPDANTGI